MSSSLTSFATTVLCLSHVGIWSRVKRCAGKDLGKMMLVNTHSY